jgi:hypothetical protein
MRPTLPATGSVNQRLPSDPPVIEVAPKPPPKLSGGNGNSPMPDGTQRLSSAVIRGRNRADLRARRAPGLNIDFANLIMDI